MALAMITASVKAELGVTQHEFDPRTPADYSKRLDNGVIQMIWVGKRKNPTLRSKVTQEGCFEDGRVVEESFWFNDRHAMSSKEIEYFLEPYDKAGYIRTRQEQTNDETVTGFIYLRPNGEQYAITSYYKQTHVFSVFSCDLLARQTTPQSQPPQPQPQQTPDAKDCEPVADAMYATLDKMPWRNVVRFHYAYNGIPTGGHAMTVWKLTEDGKVQVYDKNGTFELDTKSTELQDVVNALAVLLSERYKTRVTIIDSNYQVAAVAEPEGDYGLQPSRDTPELPVETEHNPTL
jgi:hypothetical protein